MDKNFPYWKEGADRNKTPRILYKGFLGVSLGEYCVSRREVGIGQEDIIGEVWTRWKTWLGKETTKKEIAEQVLNRVPMEKVYENIQNTVSSRISQYERSIKNNKKLEKEKSQFRVEPGESEKGEFYQILKVNSPYKPGKIWPDRKMVVLYNTIFKEPTPGLGIDNDLLEILFGFAEEDWTLLQIIKTPYGSKAYQCLLNYYLPGNRISYRSSINHENVKEKQTFVGLDKMEPMKRDVKDE